MDEQQVAALLEKAGAVVPGHFVGTNGNHLSKYVAKDRAICRPSVVSQLCEGLARRYALADIDVVVSPAVGAIALAQWIAHHLTRLCPQQPEVLAVYAEPHDDTLLAPRKEENQVWLDFGTGTRRLLFAGEKLLVRRPQFVLKRGFGADVRGKRTLVAEDTITTGGTARESVRAVRQAGGFVVGVAALAISEGITHETCDAPCLSAGMTIVRETYTEEECARHGMCAAGIAIDTQYGHGVEFLRRKGRGA